VRGSPILQDDFSGGVNLYDAAYAVKNNEARDARNVLTTNRGAIRKRDGSQVYATLAQAPLSLFGAQSPRVLIASGPRSSTPSTPPRPSRRSPAR
jgi:hypothetical protein